jgi:hypothetical protein
MGGEVLRRLRVMVNYTFVIKQASLLTVGLVKLKLAYRLVCSFATGRKIRTNGVPVGDFK